MVNLAAPVCVGQVGVVAPPIGVLKPALLEICEKTGYSWTNQARHFQSLRKILFSHLTVVQVPTSLPGAESGSTPSCLALPSAGGAPRRRRGARRARLPRAAAPPGGGRESRGRSARSLQIRQLVRPSFVTDFVSLSEFLWAFVIVPFCLALVT